MNTYIVYRNGKRLGSVLAISEVDACYQIHRDYGVPLTELRATYAGTVYNYENDAF